MEKLSEQIIELKKFSGSELLEAYFNRLDNQVLNSQNILYEVDFSEFQNFIFSKYQNDQVLMKLSKLVL